MGFELTEQTEDDEQNARVFRGKDLIALRDFDLKEKSTATAAKRLLRLALGAHLGEKPLNSRALFGGQR